MIVKRFFEPLLAQTSYLIGCGAAGEAIVIDPNRDAEQYIAAAAAHEPADHARHRDAHPRRLPVRQPRARRSAPARRCCCRTKATPTGSTTSPTKARLLDDGDRITIGNVTLDVVHTPGHTPEHLTFLVTDGAVANAADRRGRPATSSSSATSAGPTCSSAPPTSRGRWRRARGRCIAACRRSIEHEDWLQIWPGHGAGSSCGKGISAVPHSTLGYERRFNWAFRAADEEDFVGTRARRPARAADVFRDDEADEQGGPAHSRRARPTAAAPRTTAAGRMLVGGRARRRHAPGGGVRRGLRARHAQHAADDDLRDLGRLAGAVRPGLSTCCSARTPTSGCPEIVRALALIGLDRVAGYFARVRAARTSQAAAARQSRRSTPSRACGHARRSHAGRHRRPRTTTSGRAGHLPAAIHIPLGHLADRLSRAAARSAARHAVPVGRALGDRREPAARAPGSPMSAIWSAATRRGVDAALPTTR